LIVPEGFKSLDKYPTRTYVYPNGFRYEVKNIIAIKVKRTPSGDSHRLVVREKGKHTGTGVYVAPVGSPSSGKWPGTCRHSHSKIANNC
jgi:hypothetical protein